MSHLSHVVTALISISFIVFVHKFTAAATSITVSCLSIRTQQKYFISVPFSVCSYSYC